MTKNLITDNGGTLTCANFSFSVDGGPATPFETDCSNDVTVNAGTHSVTEGTLVSGYTTTYTNCSGVVIPSGGSDTCTITNNDNPATLTVTKEPDQ